MPTFRNNFFGKTIHLSYFLKCRGVHRKKGMGMKEYQPNDMKLQTIERAQSEG
jgi:hypothetical protein